LQAEAQGAPAVHTQDWARSFEKSFAPAGVAVSQAATHAPASPEVHPAAQVANVRQSD